MKEVDKELIKQLFKLVKEKVRRKFTFLEENEGYYSDDKKKNKKDSIFRKLYQEEKKELKGVSDKLKDKLAELVK